MTKKRTSGGDKVICTVYFGFGWLSPELYGYDQKFGLELYQKDPNIWHGYVKWARPVANFICADGWANTLVRCCMWPLVRAWALEMAHGMEPQKFAPNALGKAINTVGMPLCRLIGRPGRDFGLFCRGRRF